MHRTWLYLALFCLSFMQFSCGGCDSSPEDVNFASVEEEEVVTTDVNYNSEAMNEVIASFSSPVEMAI